jgi:hypothetical protein
MTRPELRVMRAVYAFLFPEVAAVLDELDHERNAILFRHGVPATDLAAWTARHVSPSLVIPATADGAADLDALHEPLGLRVASICADLAPGLVEFGYRYPTQGSSEGLFHLLVTARSDGVRAIRVLAGEYEGYTAQATNLGLAVETYRLEETMTLAPDDTTRWFISQPSARDGNLLPAGFLADLLDAGHRAVVDLAYLGSAARLEREPVDLSHENIEAVVVSLSKPYGLFRWRIGWTFARREVPTLYGQRWFHDTGRHLAGLAVLERVGPHALPLHYASLAADITHELSSTYGVPLIPSDVLLLASAPAAALEGLPADVGAAFAPYRRADTLRLCLTPYLEERVRGL